MMAIRLAHGWSCTEVAQAWDERWPEAEKSLKNVQYWEAWPRDGG